MHPSNSRMLLKRSNSASVAAMMEEQDLQQQQQQQQQQPSLRNCVFPVLTSSQRRHHYGRADVRYSPSTLSLWMTTAAVLLTMHSPTSAFVPRHHHRQQQQSFAPMHPQQQQQSRKSSSFTTTTTKLPMSFQEVSDFYQNFPMQSAILTCGVKASLADSLAQFKDSVTSATVTTLKKRDNTEVQFRNAAVVNDGGDNADADSFNWEFRRNMAYVLYGGIFVGLMCHLEYNLLFPRLFGMDHSFTTILEKVVFDDFVSAPLAWLPPAYLIKAWVYDYSMKEGLQKYWRDICENDLLIKYWTIWVPAQTVSFSVVPDHLRVAFMASVSFFWFILFSSVSHDEGTTTTTTGGDGNNADVLEPRIQNP